MRKIFLLFFLSFFIFIEINATFSYQKPHIITRKEWGADENLTYKDSPEWQKIYKKNASVKPKTPTPHALYLKKKNQEATNILVSNFADSIKTTSKQKSENGRPLVWPIDTAEKIRAITIHHTDTNTKDSRKAIQSIYKYHTLNREWGDIGYNFLIGHDGEIYEGRKGGEKAVGAHARWNNIQNIGIAMIGTYNSKEISPQQYTSLKNLVGYLIEKYNINLNVKEPFHTTCFEKDCLLPLNTTYKYPIIGHRDAGKTDCPGDLLYAQIQKLRQELTLEQTRNTIENQKYFQVFKKISDEKLLDVLAKIEIILDKRYNPKLTKIKTLIISYFKTKNPIKYEKGKDNFIKVRLSYPNKKIIIINDGKRKHIIQNDGDFLIKDGKKAQAFNFSPEGREYIEIESWNRKTSWDYKGQYNDNKFRGDIFLYLKNGELYVVNRVKIEDYLKGLGEISNNELNEKAKAIIVAARSYALWYVNHDRKFPGEFYDASDDPDIFQKYLGYDLEKRSPNLNRIVEETKGQIVTYKGEPIKTWYFSSSNGKTLSFYDYCIKNKNTKSFCETEQKKYPYLVSKIDTGGVGKKLYGHGVGLSGVGAEYLALKGWTYKMILKYFYTGSDIK